MVRNRVFGDGSVAVGSASCGNRLDSRVRQGVSPHEIVLVLCRGDDESEDAVRRELLRSGKRQRGFGELAVVVEDCFRLADRIANMRNGR